MRRMLNKILKGWTETTFHDFETWLWIISHPYNIHMSEYFFGRISSIEPEQTFGYEDT